MKSRKTMWMKTAGNLTLVAGLLGTMVAVPKISSAATKAAPKPANAMMAMKAAPKKTAPKNEQVTGAVTSIKGDVLTIAPTQKKRKGASRTVTVPATAKVTIDGKAAKLSQLSVGQKVTIKTRGSEVKSITASAAKKVAAKKATKKAVVKTSAKTKA